MNRMSYLKPRCTLVLTLFALLLANATRSTSSTSEGNGNSIKVIDVTMYSGEPIGLLRYYYLKDAVDYFFISESLETFSGHIRPNYSIDINARYFEPIRSKMVVVKLDRLEASNTSNRNPNIDAGSSGTWCNTCWSREEYQRKVLYDKIRTFMGLQRFVALMCDIDEIPNMAVVKQLPSLYHKLPSQYATYLDMVPFIYNFKWSTMMLKSLVWIKAFVVTDKLFNSMAVTGREGSRDGAAFMETFRIEAYKQPHAMVITNAGWHCSYFMSVGQIQEKIASFSHQEFNLPQFTSVKNIRKCIKHGLDLFHRASPGIEEYPGDRGYPWPLPCHLQSNNKVVAEGANVFCPHELPADIMEVLQLPTAKQIQQANARSRQRGFGLTSVKSLQEGIKVAQAELEVSLDPEQVRANKKRKKRLEKSVATSSMDFGVSTRRRPIG